jgi:hypothetical protein
MFNILVVIQEFVLASHFVGSLLTFLKQCGLLYFPVTRDLSLPSALYARNKVTCCLDFVPPWQESPQKVRVLLGCRLKNRPVSSPLYRVIEKLPNSFLTHVVFVKK